MSMDRLYCFAPQRRVLEANLGPYLAHGVRLHGIIEPQELAGLRAPIFVSLTNTDCHVPHGWSPYLQAIGAVRLTLDDTDARERHYRDERTVRLSPADIARAARNTERHALDVHEVDASIPPGLACFPRGAP